MTDPQLGALAAMTTALLWTMSMLAWTSAGRRIGAVPVCFLRLLLTCALLSTYGGLVRQRWLPSDADGRTWALLGVSGLVGFLISDLCAFRALLLIGPRRTLLLQTLSPPTAAILSWGFWGEALSMRHWAAMAVTLGGIIWVVLERPEETKTKGLQPAGDVGTGIALAVAGAMAQALGMVLSRRGIGDYDAVAATFIRALGALPGYLIFVTVIGRWHTVFAALRHTQAMAIVGFGSVVGPVLGVTMCMIALRHCSAGIVTTIVSTMPVLVLPFSILLYGERVSLRAAAGALLSVLGVALMCWGVG